jgi:hypothetical protein
MISSGVNNTDGRFFGAKCANGGAGSRCEWLRELKRQVCRLGSRILASTLSEQTKVCINKEPVPCGTGSMNTGTTLVSAVAYWTAKIKSSWSLYAPVVHEDAFP